MVQGCVKKLICNLQKPETALVLIFQYSASILPCSVWPLSSIINYITSPSISDLLVMAKAMLSIQMNKTVKD